MRKTIPIRPEAMHAEIDTPFSPGRRALVQWFAAAAALAAGGCSRTPTARIYSSPTSPERAAAGTPLYYASACDRDGWAQGVLIATRGGRPIKIEGNPAHPASLGGTDAPTQASVLALWDPDRSTTPWARAPDATPQPSSWAAFEAAWRSLPAAPVHVLTPRVTSPSLARQLARLLESRSGSRWYRHDAVEAHLATAGAELAFGRPIQRIEQPRQARVIVSFGADPFARAGSGVRFAADWADQRAADLAAARAPAQLVAVESTPSLFGARADRRWALAPPQLEAALWACAHALDGGLPRPDGLDAATARVAARIAEIVRAHPADVLLCPAPWLSAESHALVHWLHERLGTGDRTSTLIAPPDRPAGLPAPGTLAELVDAIDAHEVATLLVLGGNPLYTAPAASRFGAALARVPFSVQMGTHRDETARRCTWHLPTGHTYEQWSDLRAFDGSHTVLQPAIAPLYDTRSAHELLALLLGEPERDGHAIVRATSRSVGAGDDDAWRDSLQRGVVADSAAPPLRLAARRPPRMPSLDLRPEPLWLLTEPDVAIGDGGDANNGWLQELPRPLTKLTWDNALQIAPATASALRLAHAEVVRVHADGAPIDVPVWIQHGHAERAATLALGHGRRAAGSVGNHVGVDTAALRRVDGRPVALTLEPTGRRHDFAVTQIERSQHDRDLARLTPLDAAIGAAPARPAALPSLYDPADTLPIAQGAAWAMAIDLDACTGCNACTAACNAENNIPVVGPSEVRAGRAMHWIRVDTYTDDDPHGRALHQPVPCMHCENAPCEIVCPVGATMHDSEGLNVQVYNRCIGTRFCSNNCPYKVRRFNFRQYADVATETLRLMRNPDVTVRSRGVMEKCNYCLQRISASRRAAQRTGEARAEVRTACQDACPTRAIVFGDLNDAQSAIVRARASPRHYAMLDELGTRPRTTYLARIAPAGDGA